LVRDVWRICDSGIVQKYSPYHALRMNPLVSGWRHQARAEVVNVGGMRIAGRPASSAVFQVKPLASTMKVPTAECRESSSSSDVSSV
jgi:hypothetical protein